MYDWSAISKSKAQVVAPPAVSFYERFVGHPRITPSLIPGEPAAHGGRLSPKLTVESRSLVVQLDGAPAVSTPASGG